jgi:hypothetical protein
MATIRAHGPFVPFMLPLQDDGHVGDSEDLLNLIFNLQIGTMYLEHEMYSQIERCMKRFWFKRIELRLVLCGY